jgi:hypothetical protein
MSSGKLGSRFAVDTFALKKQRPAEAFGSMPLFASIACGEGFQILVDQAESLGDGEAQVGYLCPGRAQDHGYRGASSVYEMDQETYQTRKVA